MRTTYFALLAAFALACSAPDTTHDSGTVDARGDRPTGSDVAQLDSTTADVPVADVPTVDTPQADSPRRDVPTPDVPVVDVPVVDVPVADVTLGDGGRGGPGDLCTNMSDCMRGLLCCYPCGIPDCMNRCMAPDPRTGRCPLIP
jgi:hypothetical protein